MPSIRTRVLLYLYPALMDLVAGTLLFLSPYRAAKQMGASHTVAASLGVVWAVCCSLGGVALTRLVTPKRVGWMLTLSCSVQAASFLLQGLATTVAQLMPLMALSGLVHLFFFVPFQVLMKRVDAGDQAGEALARTTGLYTFSWSFGMACGPLVCGYLEDWGAWRASYVLMAAICVATAVGVWRLRRRTESSAFPAVPEATSLALPESMTEPAAVDVPEDAPDWAWLGWVVAGAGCFAVSIVRVVFPSVGVELGITAKEQGTTLFLVSAMQSALGFVLGLAWIKGWMYRWRPVAVLGLAGVVGMVGFALPGLLGLKGGAAWPLFLAGAAAYGIFSGAFYFYAVFHALAHPSKAGRNVAVNESVFAAAAIVGPLVGGALADGVGLGAPFVAAGILVLVAVAFQAWQLAKRPYTMP